MQLLLLLSALSLVVCPHTTYGWIEGLPLLLAVLVNRAEGRYFLRCDCWEISGAL